MAPDVLVADFAAGRHHVVSERELRGFGLGRGAIQHRVKAGRLHPVYRGVYAVLRTALIAVVDPPDTRSPLEDRFVTYCRTRQLPTPALNVTVAGYCVDAAWLSRNVVVELDSRRHHLGTAAFEEDRIRDTKLQLAGQRVVRITDKRLREEADELHEDLVRLLDLPT